MRLIDILLELARTGLLGTAIKLLHALAVKDRVCIREARRVAKVNPALLNRMLDRIEDIRKVVRELATKLARISTVTVMEAKIAREVTTEIKVYETEVEKPAVAVARKVRYVTEEETEEEEKGEEEKKFEVGEKKRRG